MRDRLGLRAHIGALARRPSLMLEAIRMLAAVRRRRRIGPSHSYLRWRIVTAYGAGGPFTADDLVGFLEWRRRMRSLARDGLAIGGGRR